MFSVAIPVYTPYKQYLSEAIDSVLQQTFTDFELLLICGDHECDDVFVADKRIRVIYIDVDDVSSKRNAALESFAGDYLLFLDADDRLHQNTLECVYNAICYEKVEIVGFGFTRVFSELSVPINSDDRLLFSGSSSIIDLCFRNMLTPNGTDPTIFDSSCGKAWSRDLIQRTGCRFLVPPCRAEDALFARELYLRADSMILLPKAIGYYWRLNHDSVMQVASPAWLDLNGYLTRARLLVKQTPYYSEQAFFNYGAGLFYQEIRFWLKKRKTKKMSAAELTHNIRALYTGKGTMLWDCIHKSALNTWTLRLAKRRCIFIAMSPLLHRFVHN